MRRREHSAALRDGAGWEGEGGETRTQQRPAAVRRYRGWEALRSVIPSFPVSLAGSHPPVRLPSLLFKLRVREEPGCPTARFDTIVQIDRTKSPINLKFKPRQSTAPHSSLPVTPLLNCVQGLNIAELDPWESGESTPRPCA